MAQPSEQTPSESARLPGITPFARIMDRAGRWVITGGGISVIAAVMGIFLFVLIESYPLFLGPTFTPREVVTLSGYGRVFAAGIDPYQAVAHVVHDQGIDFVRPETGQVIQSVRPSTLHDGFVTSAYVSMGDRYVGLGLNDGRMIAAQVNYQVAFTAEGTQDVTPELAEVQTLTLDDRGHAIVQVTYCNDGDGQALALGVTDDGRLLMARTVERRGLLGRGASETRVYDLSGDVVGRVSSVAAVKSVQFAFAGTDQGEVFRWDLGRSMSRPQPAQRFQASLAGVTALGFLLGDISLVIGDADGGVTAWMPVRVTENTNAQTYRKIHTLASHRDAVTTIGPSSRDKQFLTADRSGQVALHHVTSEQTFFTLNHAQPVTGLAFAPKANGFLALTRDARIARYDLHNPHPEITFKTLFGKVWYEGYGEPEYVWQSTGGSDDFEPKLSLVPLIFGTAKGTFYAMLFALPLAVLAAIYTSEFAPPAVRNLVKPIVELMASLPSVILGFLAGLWLAPVLEKTVVGALMLLPMVPLVVVGCSWLWGLLPEERARRVPAHVQLALLAGITLFAGWLAFALGPVVERLAFGGNFQVWLLETSGTRYDQRNSLIIGFAMGFAVVPIIYTICEDALSSVPSHLRAGSLALGATPWQTAIRVVLPTASPGIFSATMIGFGRAVGETMIVLMATGNTPIMDWSIFNGMRTLSANIAVEIPEAPHSGTLYRVLFLTGLLLAAVTFLVNTLAEVVRQRLRERYSRI